jgi:signal transduction histidine kinase
VGIYVNAAAGKARVAITDNGQGIEKENLDRIFEKFFRVKKDDDQTETGSGLGLSIARSIALAHKGSIEVESEVNKGTTFTVILPAIDLFG